MIAHVVFFFFFQAEDGIRDGTVTGVQTCALPISSERPLVPYDVQSLSATIGREEVVGGHRDASRDGHDAADAWNRFRLVGVEALHLAAKHRARSEERRVEKECRSRWMS